MRFAGLRGAPAYGGGFRWQAEGVLCYIRAGIEKCAVGDRIKSGTQGGVWRIKSNERL